MAGKKVAQLPSPVLPWVNSSGHPSQSFMQFMQLFAAGNLGPLVSAPDDATAAKNGVSIGQIYESSGTVRIRKV